MTTTTDRPEGDAMQDTSSTARPSGAHRRIAQHAAADRLDLGALRQRAQDARAATVLTRSRRTQRAAVVTR